MQKFQESLSVYESRKEEKKKEDLKIQQREEQIAKWKETADFSCKFCKKEMVSKNDYQEKFICPDSSCNEKNKYFIGLLNDKSGCYAKAYAIGDVLIFNRYNPDHTNESFDIVYAGIDPLSGMINPHAGLLCCHFNRGAAEKYLALCKRVEKFSTMEEVSQFIEEQKHKISPSILEDYKNRPTISKGSESL